MVAGLDVAAVDGNGPAAAASEYALAAADGRAAVRGCGGDRAAVDGDGAAAAAVSAVAAADACAAVVAGGGDSAAVDGDLAATAAGVPPLDVAIGHSDDAAAADARAVVAVGLDDAAVDGNGAAAAAAAAGLVEHTVASDGRVVDCHVPCGQLAGAVRLPVDGQGVGAGSVWVVVIVLNLNAAVDCEGAAICQDQVYITADGDAATDLNCALHHIPAGCPFGVAAGYLRGAVAGLRRAGFVQIGHAALRQRHRG